MKLLPGCAIALTLVASMLAPLGCGDAKQKPLSEQLRDVEIRSLAAYACMPQSLRSELRVLERRHNARVAALAKKAGVPAGATGGTTLPPNYQQTVENDPIRTRLVRRARVIYGRYLPGGDDYDESCYQRERAAAQSRLEKLGTTG
jgi:hypothetical protein